MKERLHVLAAGFLLGAGARAQRVPDPRVLLPDGYRVYVSADGARVRASSLWGALSRGILVGKMIEGLPTKAGVDPDGVERMIIGINDVDEVERVSVVLEGRPELRATSFVEAMARSAEQTLTEQTIGRSKVWLPAEGRHSGPGTADLGPGTLWLASPAVLRERLGATDRNRPARPNHGLATALEKEGGTVFVALDGEHEILAGLQEVATEGGLRMFRAVCARIELTPAFEADVTLVPDREDDPAKVRDFLQRKIAVAAEELKALRLPILAKQCSQVRLETRGREIGCVFKLGKGQESALLTLGMLFTARTQAIRMEVVEAEVVAEEIPVPASAPASGPAPKK